MDKRTKQGLVGVTLVAVGLGLVIAGIFIPPLLGPGAPILACGLGIITSMYAPSKGHAPEAPGGGNKAQENAAAPETESQRKKSPRFIIELRVKELAFFRRNNGFPETKTVVEEVSDENNSSLRNSLQKT